MNGDHAEPPIQGAPEAAMEKLLARRDAQIAELQQAVIDLAGESRKAAQHMSRAIAELGAQLASQVDNPAADYAGHIAELGAQLMEIRENGLIGQSVEIEALIDRVDALESRQIEQDRTIRHTLTMLIEWIEDDTGRAAA